MGFFHVTFTIRPDTSTTSCMYVALCFLRLFGFSFQLIEGLEDPPAPSTRKWYLSFNKLRPLWGSNLGLPEHNALPARLRQHQLPV
jgi:hypothetical protein